jgi:hypothetical protein
MFKKYGASLFRNGPRFSKSTVVEDDAAAEPRFCVEGLTMARWKPQANLPIGLKEPVGRRLFDEPMLLGAANQPHYGGLDLRNFQETRDNEYSLDRLGKTGIDGAVIRYLKPRAIAGGKSFRKPKKFNGWIAVKSETLTSPPPTGKPIVLMASPVSGEDLDENAFHAHAIRPEDQTDLIFALYLRHLFSSGTIERNDEERLERSPSVLRRWIAGLLSFLR